MSIAPTLTEPFAAPVVDSLRVRVVVDSAYDRFIGDATHPMVGIEHVRHIPGHERSTLPANGGCRCIWNRRRQAASQYLLDFGFTPEVLIRNFELLDLDPGHIDGLILSHGIATITAGSTALSRTIARNAPRRQTVHRRRECLSREMDQAA